MPKNKYELPDLFFHKIEEALDIINNAVEEYKIPNPDKNMSIGFIEGRFALLFDRDKMPYTLDNLKKIHSMKSSEQISGFISEAKPVIEKFNELLVKYEIKNPQKNTVPVIMDGKLNFILGKEIMSVIIT